MIKEARNPVFRPAKFRRWIPQNVNGGDIKVKRTRRKIK